MPLTNQEANDLQLSINGYDFPPVYFDFVANAQVDAGNMCHLESVIGGWLLSPQLQHVKDGLGNVIYWGNANAGYQMSRTNKFMENVTTSKLQQFQALVADGNTPTLKSVGDLDMPQFSGVSFVSKIVAFIDPTNYCVLDLRIARLRHLPGNKALHRLTVGSQIGITRKNSAAYTVWCEECRAISNQYYGGKYRAVDIERGFFNLIQKDLAYAQQIYIDA